MGHGEKREKTTLSEENGGRSQKVTIRKIAYTALLLMGVECCQALTQRIERRLSPVGQVQFIQNIADVLANRPFADGQLFGDFLVG